MGKFVNYVRNEKRFILSLVLMILGLRLEMHLSLWLKG